MATTCLAHTLAGGLDRQGLLLPSVTHSSAPFALQGSSMSLSLTDQAIG